MHVLYRIRGQGSKKDKGRTRKDHEQGEHKGKAQGEQEEDGGEQEEDRDQETTGNSQHDKYEDLRSQPLSEVFQ